MGGLAVLVGLTAEARLAAPLGCLVLAGGGSAAGAEDAVRRLLAAGATGLISFGLAGGLDPALRPGTLIVPEAVILACLPQWPAPSPQTSSPARQTSSHTLQTSSPAPPPSSPAPQTSSPAPPPSSPARQTSSPAPRPSSPGLTRGSPPAPVMRVADARGSALPTRIPGSSPGMTVGGAGAGAPGRTGARAGAGAPGGTGTVIDPTGTVIDPTGTATDPTGTTSCRIATDPALSQLLGGLTPHTLFGGTAIVTSAAEKRHLHDATGAAAVDLESAAVARAALAHGLPFAVLRAICDPADRDLPPAALTALNHQGAIGLLRVIASLLAHPRQLPALMELAADAAAARRALATRVAAIGQLSIST